MFILILTFLFSTAITQNSSQLTQYQTSLKQIVDSIQNNVNKMMETSNKGLQEGNLLSSSETLSAQVYKTTLNSTRQIITQTLGHSSIPYALKKQNCTYIPETDFYAIVTQNKQLQENSKILTDKLSQISNLSSCPQVEELKAQNNLLNEESKIFSDELSQLCIKQTSNIPPPATGNTSVSPINNQNAQSKSNSFVNNLDNGVGNWIYGNINPQQFYSGVNKQISQGAKLCPSQNPYIDINNICISCPIIYNVAAKKCASCPSGSNLNQNIHQCDTSSGETIIKNSNPSAKNFIGTQSASISNLSSCSDNSPFFDGNQCINCSLPNYFDYSSSVCLMCGKGQQFDVNSKICKPVDNSVNPSFNKYNSNVGSNVANYVGSPTNINNADSCPHQQPFFNGLNCISCALPLYFNFTSKVCEACQQNYIFSANTKNCIIDPSKIYYSNILNGVTNFVGVPPILVNSADKIVKPCSSTTPFSNGKVCLQCSLPRFYNYETNQCEKCSNDLMFNISTKTCVAKAGTILKNSNIDSISNFMFAVPQYNDSLNTCESNAPYFNGAACISCNLPSYFNFKTFICENCPIQQRFNPQNRLCEFVNQKFISDTNNQNIYYNGNYQAFANEINSKKQSNPQIQVCASSTPFYSTTTNQCISCPEDTPIYNIKYSRCISCGSDSSFDPSSRICIYNQRVGLSLERTLMNTFSL